MLFFLKDDKERNQGKLGFKRCKKHNSGKSTSQTVHIMNTSITGSRDFTVAFTQSDRVP